MAASLRQRCASPLRSPFRLAQQDLGRYLDAQGLRRKDVGAARRHQAVSAVSADALESDQASMSSSSDSEFSWRRGGERGGRRKCLAQANERAALAFAERNGRSGSTLCPAKRRGSGKAQVGPAPRRAIYAK